MPDFHRLTSLTPLITALSIALASGTSAAYAVEPAFNYAYDQVMVDGPIPAWQFNFDYDTNYGPAYDNYGNGTRISTVVYSGNGFNGTTPTDAWNWVASPSSPTGKLAHQSALAAGVHQQYYYYANDVDFDNMLQSWVAVSPDTSPSQQSFYTYVYLDPAAPPSYLSINWEIIPNGTADFFSGGLAPDANSWAHAAYWGANAGDSPAYHYMGPMPAAGGWVKLEVPLSALDEDVNYYFDVEGMAFTLVGGRATFGGSGVTHAAIVQPQPVPFYQYVLPQGQWDIFYTSNLAELGAGAYGYQFQGPVCALESNPSIATIPLTRVYQPATGHHCYLTMAKDEPNPLNDDQAHTLDPWNWEGNAGYLYTSQVPGTVPFYRFLNNYIPIHAYSTNSNLGAGWTFQCLEGYVFPAGVGSN
jgi:hypothetical protein